MRILITGASGLLGSKLSTIALASGHDVQAPAHEHATSDANLLMMDITDQAAVEKTIAGNAPDVVIHAASITDLELCERNPELAYRVNAAATGFLANACRKQGSFLIYVSTDYVFDGERGNYREADTVNPLNIYGKSKLLGETEVVQKAAGNYCIARTSVVFGWGRKYRPNFATWVCDKLRIGEKISVVADQYATPTISNNLARMLLEVAERRINGVYHLSGSTRINRYDFAVLLARRLSLNENLLTPTKAEAVGWIARRPFDSSLNVAKAQNDLHNKPNSLNEALDEFAAETHAGM